MEFFAEIFLWMISLSEWNWLLGGIINALICVIASVLPIMVIVFIANLIFATKEKVSHKDEKIEQQGSITSKSLGYKVIDFNKQYNLNNQHKALENTSPSMPTITPKGTAKQLQDQALLRKDRKEIFPLSSSTAGVVDFNVGFCGFCGFCKSYPKFFIPAKAGGVVYPYRQYRTNLRGYKEQEFEVALRKHLQGTSFRVLGDVCLCFAENTRPYEPDIAIVDTKSSIRIDVEIDEPYSGFNRTPCHYIDCGDVRRDFTMTSYGWVVVRFSERQVHESLQECLSFISTLIKKLQGGSVDLMFYDTECLWTLRQAQEWEKVNYRESYLGIDYFGEQVVFPRLNRVSQLTEDERESKKQGEVLYFSVEDRSSKKKSYNLTFSNNRDQYLLFDADSHTYLYQGLPLIAVSTLVSSIFPEFDKDYWGAKKAREKGVSTTKMLEDWDCKGAMSREVGTFLHEQIENRFLKNPILSEYQFKYEGKEVQMRETISITKELEYFEGLLQHPVFRNNQVYRTEWRIYDEELGLAGTIDCLLKSPTGRYIIVDWKRSEKVGSLFGNTFSPTTTNQFQSGVGIFSYIPDTSYNRYKIQQNLYAYILKERYNIKVDALYLAVIHPKYDRAYLVEVDFDYETIELLLEAFMETF